MNKYGQFCPVAKAMELLDERWTLLIIRELLAGSRHWGEIRQGVPRMSPALLAKRLRTLSRAGVIERHREGKRVVYIPTSACEELRPVVEALGTWGVRWVPELGDEDFDPHVLLWDMHRRVDLERVPNHRTVIQFTFTDVEPAVRDWWLVIYPSEVDICHDDPGFDVDVYIECALHTLVRIWRGDKPWAEALRDQLLQVHGPEALQRQLPEWFKLSYFAAVPRSA
jgi:DNA-binding HxlR family transcriptional regulator